MKSIVVSLGALMLASGAARAASDQQPVSRIFQADKTAVGGQSASAMRAEFAFAGSGLTGKLVSLTDLERGRYVDAVAAGPVNMTNGFDGAHAWAKDPSGTVTLQDGGEQRALAVNDAYRRANLWWRSDFGGAQVKALGLKKDEAGATYDAVSVTPDGGKTFEAWFGTADHLLHRVVETAGAKTVVTTSSDYRSVGGAMEPGKIVIDEGDGAKYLQTLTLISASFQPKASDAAFAPPKVELADSSIEGGAAETVLPFHMINNHIYAQAKVNGQGPYTFIFDTGGLNLVTPTMARTLGLKTSGAMAGGGAGEGTVEVAFAKVAQLDIGAATLKDQTFVVLPLDEMLSNIEGVPEQGMIGFETFRRFVTRVDYGAKTVTLIDPRRFDPKDAGTAIHFDFDDKNPQIAGTFEGIPGKFDIDTGSRAEVTLNKPFSERNGLRAKHPRGADMVDGWGVGGPSRGYVTRGALLTLGPVEVKSVVATLTTQTKGAFAGDAYQGNIGGGVLKRFVVTFDYGRQIMYLKPLPTPPEDIGGFDRAGMWFNVSGDGFKIVDVTANGPAEAAGLKVGDEIVGIDGQPSNTVKIYELRRRLRSQPPGTVVALKVARSGASREVKVTLRDLI